MRNFVAPRNGVFSDTVAAFSSQTPSINKTLIVFVRSLLLLKSLLVCPGMECQSMDSIQHSVKGRFISNCRTSATASLWALPTPLAVFTYRSVSCCSRSCLSLSNSTCRTNTTHMKRKKHTHTHTHTLKHTFKQSKNGSKVQQYSIVYLQSVDSSGSVDDALVRGRNVLP